MLPLKADELSQTLFAFRVFPARGCYSGDAVRFNALLNRGRFNERVNTGNESLAEH